jgi:undecaprenyl-phosphate 4-deoxy-4-formamido-L-arabinose transferase
MTRRNPTTKFSLLLATLDEHDRAHNVVCGTPQGSLPLTNPALTSAMDAETARSVSAFRACRTRLGEGFRDCYSPTVSIDVQLNLVHFAHRRRFGLGRGQAD